MGIINNDSCALCNQAVEIRDHLYFECPISNPIWDIVCIKNGSSNANIAFEDVVKENNNNSKMLKSVLQNVSLSVTVYIKWKSINETMLKNDQIIMDIMCRRIEKLIQEASYS